MRHVLVGVVFTDGVTFPTKLWSFCNCDNRDLQKKNKYDGEEKLTVHQGLEESPVIS